MTEYQRKLWRRITYSNAMRLESEGKAAEAKREYGRIWADARGCADDDREVGF